MFNASTRRALRISAVATAVFATAAVPQAATAAPKKAPVIEGVSVALVDTDTFALAARDTGRLVLIDTATRPFIHMHVRVHGRPDTLRRVKTMKAATDFPVAGKVTEVVEPSIGEPGSFRLEGPTGATVSIRHDEQFDSPPLGACIRVAVHVDGVALEAQAPARPVTRQCMKVVKPKPRHESESSDADKDNENRDRVPGDDTGSDQSNENRDKDDNSGSSESNENRDNDNGGSQSDRNRDRDNRRNGGVQSVYDTREGR